MREILIFYGPNSKFEKIVKGYREDSLSLYEILETTREVANNSQPTVELKEHYDSIIVRSTDFANLSDTGEKILNHMLIKFIEAFDIKHIFLQNPTKTVERIISLMVENKKREINLDIYKNDYPKVLKKHLFEFHQNYSQNIIGQVAVEKDILNMLYRLYKLRNNDKPLVLMFYGPSGVGKTETAKYISNIIENNEPFRSQLSMYQNNKSMDYLFGEEHNAQSFALDLLDRESNILLLDEFDKANRIVYSAFYQMFDEGVFEDRNYQVYLKDTIIICTSNYNDKNDIRNQLGDPLYYRFDKIINFQTLNREDVLKIIGGIYEEVCSKLDESETSIVNESGLLEHVKGNVDKLIAQGSHNYRQLDSLMEDMIDSLLVKKLINDFKIE